MSSTPLSKRLLELIRYNLAGQLAQRPPVIYARCRAALAACDEADEGERRAARSELLRALLKQARKAPYYAALLQGGLDEAALAALPPLTKAELRQDPARFLSSRLRPSAPAQTGGTTGLPLTLRRTPASIVYEQATIDHTASRVGVDLAQARVAVLRGDSIKDANDTSPPFWRQATPKKWLFSAHHLSPRTIGDYAAALREVGPDVITAYPSALDHLVALLEASGESVGVSAVITSSERLPEGLRERVRRVLGARLLDYYGQAERVSFAWSIEDGRYFFRGDYGLVEFAAAEGGLWSTLCTGLHNDLLPLLRYEVGDLFDLGGAPDAATRDRISLGVLPFPAIIGRSAEFVLLPDGRRVIGLNHIPRGVDGAVSVQLVQRAPDRVVVVVVPGPGWGEPGRRTLDANLRAKLPDSVSVEVVLQDAPVRLPSGKAPLYVNEM